MLQLYADAQAALERIEERRRLSPVRKPWRIRTLIAERQALARIDNSPIADDSPAIDGRGAVTPSPFDLSHGRHAVGASISLDALLSDGAALLDWLGVRSTSALDTPLIHPVGRSWADMLLAVEDWRRDVAALPPAPPLLHSGRIAQLWRRHAPIGQGDLVGSLLIGDRWGPGRWVGSAGGLVALGLEHGGAAWKVITGEALDRVWLDATLAGARVHLDLEMRLRAYARRAAFHLAQRRRPGRLKDVLMLAMIHPRLSSGSVARALDLTSAGAIKLLTIATNEGLLIEQSGQASYRSYALPVSMPGASISALHARSGPFDPEFWSDETENGAPPERL